MLLKILNFLGGWYILSGKRKDSTAFLNLCMRLCLPYWGFVQEEDAFFVCVRRRVGRELLAECKEKKIDISLILERGLPRFLHRYRGRWGLAFGGILCVFLIWLSGRFVWRVEVSGTERYDMRDVIEELEALGFGVGSYIPPVDVNILQNRFLLASDRFAWITVNIFGTTAQVEVVEISERSRETREQGPANLIASGDGQIVLLEVRSGFPAIRMGDVVLAGDLLVSGIGETADMRTLVCRAEGRIYAEVLEHVSVEIPYAYNKKTYTGEKKSENKIIFFGKEINLFKKTGILGGSCDTIENERILSVFGQIRIPISIITTTSLYYTEESARRDETSAEALAAYMLEEQIKIRLADAELIQQILETTVTDSSVRLDCTLRCIRNIAQTAPIALGSQADGENHKG